MWLHSEIRTLGDIPRHYARTLPDKAALIDANGPVSFAALDAAANRTAQALRLRGIGPGSRVAFMAKNTTRYFEVLFGVLKLGAALIPLNWRLAPPELEAVMADGQPALLIADREYETLAAQIAAAAGGPCPVVLFDSAAPGKAAFDAWQAAASAEDPNVDVNPWHTAVLMYTSGTTGKPKGVQQTHQAMLYLRLCEHLDPSFRYTPDDVMLTVAPLFHAMGLGLSLQALYHGAAVAVYGMPDPGTLIRMIARDRPTILPLVPTVIQMVLDHPDAPSADYSSVRLVVYAGSGIAAHTLERAIRAMKCGFMQFYGATETCAGVTFLRPEQHRLDQPNTLRSCGSPLPLIEIRVADADGHEVPTGQVGEFLIRTPSITSGYFNQPETTAAAFRDGWYRSGDAGYRDEEGLLYIVDRVKDMIISGGENIYSTEVEQALASLRGVQMCAVVGLPDERWGERVVAAVQADPAAGLTPEAVIAHCRNLIAGYKLPKQVVFVPGLPMTPTGKVKKRALREQLLDAARAAG